MVKFEVDQTINGDGTYTLGKPIVYLSPRYNKVITVPAGRVSDGATRAIDIVSIGWWVHDELCLKGKWDDGTPLSNWQCSQVLQDILNEEGRSWRGHYWFWFTWMFGGDKARKNGMISIGLVLLITAGCSTYNVTVNPSPGCANVTINGSKEISTLPIRADGNTVPVSAVP